MKSNAGCWSRRLAVLVIAGSWLTGCATASFKAGGAWQRVSRSWNPAGSFRQGWTCRVYIPVSELIYAAFRSNAKGLLPPSDE